MMCGELGAAHVVYDSAIGVEREVYVIIYLIRIV